MIPIITYHALGQSRSPVFTNIADFEKQLAALANLGYQSISLSVLLQWLKGEVGEPENGVIFTFDDGYESVYSQAWPLMEAYGFKGTLFVISDYCGKNNQWPGQMDGIPERPLMTWDQLAEMAAYGWELGAHTRTHPMLPRLTQPQIEDEIIASRKEIEQRTGFEVKLFAQPYGQTNEQVNKVVAGHFDGAVSTVLGLVERNSSPYQLPRIDAYYLARPLINNLKKPIVRHYLTLRQAIRQLRQAARPSPY